MNRSHLEALEATANAIAAGGKGILAADESIGTIGKRFNSIGLDNNFDNRTRYRQLLFSAPRLEEAISGVIIYEETFDAKTADGPLIEGLSKRNICLGIKLDKGTVVFNGREKITLGLDSLEARAAAFYAKGARFAKWRNVISIDVAAGLPSVGAIEANAWVLARYARVCQEQGIVPIVEPEVLVLDGDHSLATSARITRLVLSTVFEKLIQIGVYLPGILLKPNMVLPGSASAEAATVTPAAIAAATVAVLRDTVPAACPGIVFLSGGQSEAQATANLNAMNRLFGDVLPWSVSFSFGRALQFSAIKAWNGSDDNTAKAQEVLLERALLNGKAQLGLLEDGEDSGADAAKSLYVEGYTY